MKKLLELRSTKAELHKQMKAIVTTAETEKRSLTNNESTKFEELQKQITNLNQKIECEEVLADNERSLITGETPESKIDKPSNEELRAFVQTGDQRSLSAGTNADGGYTVIPAIDKEITKVLKETSVFRQNATTKTISTEKYEKLVSVGGTSATWADEGDTRSETNTSQLEKVQIAVHSLYAYPKTTQELLDWSDFDVSGWLSSEVADETGLKEEAAFWTGDGSKKPKGLLTYTRDSANDASRTFGELQEIESSATGVIDGDDLITLSHTLRTAYRMAAKFYMNDAMLEKVRKLKDNDDNYLFRAGIVEGAPDTLLGKPIVIAEEMSDDLIGYGDLARAYYVIDHTSGTRMIRDNITLPGWVKMLTTRYVGGGLVDSNAFKFLVPKAA
ncbi:phage major capsid protein [Alteromonas sp. M12]|uniref:phage major capsid protein n=1 Tax=Alteromonas sp. M12 TaxID=3135644 RepID=UPI00319E1D5C